MQIPRSGPNRSRGNRGPLGRRGLQLALILSWPGSPLHADEPVRVLLLGDSITQGDVSGPTGVPYAERLARLLGAGYDVRNLGCSSTSSADWHPRAGPRLCAAGLVDLWKDRVAPNLPADVVIVLLGTNDAIGFLEPARTSSSDYRMNLRQLLMALRSAEVPRTILLTPPARCPRASPDAHRLLERYGDVIRDLCSTLDGVECGPDLHRRLDVRRDFFRCDVHPNREGHERIARMLAAEIRGDPSPNLETIPSAKPSAPSGAAPGSR